MSARKIWLMIGVLFLIVVFLTIIFVISKQYIIFKAPLMQNVYFVKIINNKNYTFEELFDMYILKMKEDGYEYIEEERLGGILLFRKNGINKGFIYPKFIKFKWFI